MTEAEYIAAAHATKEVMWLRTFMGEIAAFPTVTTTIHCDNQSTIALSKDGQYHMWTKHINIRFHFIRKAIKDGMILLTYCPTQIMTADLLTKPLNCTKTEEHVRGLGLLAA